MVLHSLARDQLIVHRVKRLKQFVQIHKVFTSSLDWKINVPAGEYGELRRTADQGFKWEIVECSGEIDEKICDPKALFLNMPS